MVRPRVGVFALSQRGEATTCPCLSTWHCHLDTSDTSPFVRLLIAPPFSPHSRLVRPSFSRSFDPLFAPRSPSCSLSCSRLVRPSFNPRSLFVQPLVRTSFALSSAPRFLPSWLLVHPSFAPRSPPCRSPRSVPSNARPQCLKISSLKRASHAPPQHDSNTPSSEPLNARMPSMHHRWASNKPTSEPQTRLQERPQCPQTPNVTVPSTRLIR
jgi:hypothetical protein